jgi:hypothetical protein
MATQRYCATVLAQTAEPLRGLVERLGRLADRLPWCDTPGTWVGDRGDASTLPRMTQRMAVGRETAQDQPKKEGIEVTTLIVAAVASAVAAVLVREIWGSGTIIAAAATPVLVTILSETLRRPTKQVSRAITVRRAPSGTHVQEVQEDVRIEDRRRLRDRDRDPDPDFDPPYDPVVGPPGADLPPSEGEMRVYRNQPRKRRLNPKVIVITGVLAFAIAAAALTLPEILFGSSVGSTGGGGTTLFGGDKNDLSSATEDEKKSDEKTTTSDEETKTVTEPSDEQTVPEDQSTTTTPSDETAPDSERQGATPTVEQQTPAVPPESGGQ